MMQPLVSILLPAYNAAQYLSDTIDSVLSQTYTHFELLLLDDGSIDGTSAVVSKYTDSRIKYMPNNGNKGLVYTLNRGLQEAKGKYIARLDADDICLPERLAKQVAWLEQRPQTTIVTTCVTLINEKNEPAGVWPIDRKAISAADIKKYMAWENCIAHPTVMFNAALIKGYYYSAHQKHIEDYDLWLHLLADGHVIEKIATPLLLYRIHSQSVTGSVHRKKNPFFTIFHGKRKFLTARLRKLHWGWFESQVLFTMCCNMVMGIGKEIKRQLKR